MAERVGFEPTCPLRDKTLSRRPRYDHFGTSPGRVSGPAEAGHYVRKAGCVCWRRGRGANISLSTIHYPPTDSGPAEALRRKRQRSHAAAGHRKDRIRDRREHRRQWRLTETGRTVLRGPEVDLDRRRRLCNPHRLVLVEVAFRDAPTVDGDFPVHEVAQPLDDGSLRLMDRVQRIDDVAPDVHRHPDLVDLHAVLRVHAHLGDFGYVTAMAVLERRAHRRASRQRT